MDVVRPAVDQSTDLRTGSFGLVIIGLRMCKVAFAPMIGDRVAVLETVSDADSDRLRDAIHVADRIESESVRRRANGYAAAVHGGCVA